MMEGMSQLGQEDYIWAMRDNANTLRENESDIDLPSARLATSLSARKSKFQVDIEHYDEQTRVMASLVPDEVIYNVDDYSHRQYDACFLFGDVSGFTELCEKYNKIGVAGPSRMTQVLNKYLGSMVQEVLSHNGDVLKFSGDAFLALFKASETQSIRDAVHEAIDCALVIQKKYGSYITDVGVVIRVKLAISAGRVTFALIGTKTTSHYVVVGKPIWDVKAAEHISSAGDIIVAPAAWHYVNTNEYLFKDMPDKIHVKIVGVGPNWRSVQKTVRVQKRSMLEEGSTSDSDSSEDDDVETHEAPGEEFSLRPAVNLAVRLEIKEALRRFIISPVMKSIDINEPFEYLTEMRLATIVFINVVSFQLQTEETVMLADHTYKAVCSVVDKMNGCVNKVSLFDKDLMFVVIFGLRGLKHELECQAALKCAKECHTAIDKLPNVLSTSIGVTTGKTYCGVFGHTLRREYTVISLIVNKAARLMVAYKDKVTCDRETFLHSKLEAKHFILQQYKPLKGISHPGPVYEYIEAETQHDVTARINACPLLGRSNHLRAYENLLEKMYLASSNEEVRYKMLLIKGEARQGKTRLLDEFVYVTPEGIPVNRFTLRKADQKIPYQTLRLIFNLPLSIKPDMTIAQKEKNLSNMLKNAPGYDLVCVLNEVFGVNFEKTQFYMSLKPPEKRLALKKMIKLLAHVSFVRLWVIAIDDCEHMDESSWEVFDALFEVKNLLIVATMAREKVVVSLACKTVLSDKRIKTMQLRPVERLFLGALACQILDVYAISPELEKAIQTKSNGNPGWIESFLISLIQDRGLYILKATLRQVHDLGLVCPPLYMMARLTDEERFRWQQVMEERKSAGDYLGEADNWQRYIDSCRDSFLNVTVREQLEAISKGGKVPICVIGPNFSISAEEMERSIDAMILKTFDSLDFYEQLLVKCSATLGNQFLRDMLEYVMSASNKRQVALAVKKLFEIKVLICAKGDFIEGGGMVFRERLINPLEQVELICQCKGISVYGRCSDLPKYASCGYMQFRSSLFRDITYNLLTDNQKKEFHHRAIRYLERETRKCKACGGDYFENILGFKYDEEFLNYRNKVTHLEYKWDVKQSTKSSCGSIQSGSISTGTSFSSSIHSGSNLIPNRNLGLQFRQSIFQKTISKAKHHQSFFGVSMIKKLKDSLSLTKAFSTEDFTDCQCNLILCNVYAQLIEHCKGAGDLNRLIEALLEYAYLCITLSNNALALSTLDETLDALRRKSILERTENMWKFTLVRAKIFILIGYARMEMGHLDQALDNLHMALNEYRITFPTGMKRRMKTCLFKFRHFLGLYVLPNTFIKKLGHWEIVYANNLSECLSHLCTLYMIKEEWENAEMAATWSLTKCLESFSDFKIICVACANMIFVAMHYERWNVCVALEIYSLRLCHLKRSDIVAEDLKCVAKLYSVIFASRVIQTHFDKVIQMGYIVLRLCNSIRVTKIVLPLLPHLLYALLIGKHFVNANAVLREMYELADDTSETLAKMWYYAEGLGLQIETGFTVVAFNICENFYQLEGASWLTKLYPDAGRRFCSVMWLWCMRNEHWEAAKLWSNVMSDFLVVASNDSVINKRSALYVLEGLLLKLVSKLDKRNVPAVKSLESDINQLIQSLEKASKSAKIILPRLYHLKAYHRYIKCNDSKVVSLLEKATRYAKKQGNLLEVEWIEHSTKAWNNELSPEVAAFWRDHSEFDTAIDFNDSGVIEPIGFFTLPTPLFQ